MLFDTDLTNPSMWSLPTGGGAGGGGGGFGAELGWLAEVLGWVACWSFELLHAAKDNAVAPVSNRMGSRASEILLGLTDINASPIADFTGQRVPAAAGFY